jgi:hypothetical protein
VPAGTTLRARFDVPQDVAEDLGPAWVTLRVRSGHPIAQARVFQRCQHGRVLSQPAKADFVREPAIQRASASPKGGHAPACVSECGNQRRAGMGRRQSGAEEGDQRVAVVFSRSGHGWLLQAARQAVVGDADYSLGVPNVDLQGLYAEFESRAFPESWAEWEHDGLTVASNAGGHAIVLAESEEFWDDDDGSAGRAAHQRLEPLCRSYEAAAIARWGSPRTVDITSRLARESSPFTELLLELGTVRGSFWDRGERGLGLSLCQMDKETPIQVVAFIVSAGEL